MTPYTPEEIRLTQPFPQPNLETARRLILGSVSDSATPLVQARVVVRRACATELHAIFPDLTLPQGYLEETYDGRRRLAAAAALLDQGWRFMTPAVDELAALGVGPSHRELLQHYLDSPDVPARISAACSMILVAAMHQL